MFSRFLAILSLALLTLGGAQAQAEQIAVETQLTPIAAQDGMAVWSTSEGFRRPYRLKLYSGGIVSTLPVSPRAVPFDAEMGTANDGSAVITYSRCKNERADAQLESCALREYSVKDAVERALGPKRVRGRSFVLPSRAGARFAYAEIFEGAPLREPVLRVSRRTDGKTLAVHRGGARATGDGSEYTGPTALDLSAQRLAFTWRAPSGTCRRTEPSGDSGGSPSRSEVWVVGWRSGDDRVRLRASCNGTSYGVPTLSANHVQFLARRNTATIISHALSSRTELKVRIGSRVVAAAEAGGMRFTVVGSALGTGYAINRSRIVPPAR